MNKLQEKYFSRLKEIAQNNNAKLITTEWLGATTYHEFLLGKEIIKLLPMYLKKYGWPKDIKKHINHQSGKLKNGKEHLIDLKIYAESRGGKLISTIWNGCEDQYEFSDIMGNKFKQTGSSIKSGNWKKEGSIAEECCRQAMSYIFNCEFNTTKKILTAKILNRKMPLELDGYNENLKIAFEYQGHPSHWNPKYKNYEKRIVTDKIKVEVCRDLGIDLIVIPPLPAHVWHKIESFKILSYIILVVKNNISKNNVKFLDNINIDNFHLDLSKTHAGYKQIEKLKIIATKNNGKLISKQWRGNSYQYTFEFSDGQRFKMMASNMKNRGWPKNQADYMKTDADRLSDMEKIAIQNKGILLSNKWLGNAQCHSFLFENGKEFEMSWTVLSNSGWPQDPDRYLKTDIDYYNELKEKAQQAEFTLMEEKWLGSHTRHHFKFKDGTDYYQKPNKLTQGFPENLNGYIRVNKADEEKLEEMRRIAHKNNGKLISTEWLGNEEKHTFEFADGRRFDIAPSKIKHRAWPKDPNYYFKQVLGQTKTKEEKLQELQLIAIKNGGKLLSTEYVTLNKKLDFEFTDGRKFQTTPDYLLKNGWPKNPDGYFKNVEGKSKRKALTAEDRLKELANIAKKHKGKLLSTEWIGQRKEYTFQFKCGEKFKMLGENMLRQGWPQDEEKYLQRYRKI